MRKPSWLRQTPIAHRGLHDGNKMIWENTPSAFQRAMQRNYAIECDVHLTADGDVIVFHDHDLKRLTGQDGYVWQRTAAEMTALRIGGTEDHPLTLRELLDLVDGKVPLVIELKGSAGHDEGLVATVARQMEKYRGKAALMSFDHWIIRDFPRHAPEMSRGLTAEGNTCKEIEAHFSMLAHDIDFVSYCAGHLPNPFVTFVRERLNMPVISWTICDEAAARHSNLHADQITFEGFEPLAKTV